MNTSSSGSNNPVRTSNSLAEYWANIAQGYANSASSSKDSASSSATSAATSASNASTSASNAATSATNASTSATSAATSEDNAEIWAEGTDAEVSALGGQHSAKKWADMYSHVYIGTTQPTDENVDIWLNPNGTQGKTSQLVNDSGFIDKDVNNLTNYTKTSDLGDLALKDTVDYETEVTNKPDIPTKTSDLTNDSNFQNSTQVASSISTALTGYATETYVNNHHDSTKYDSSNPSGYQNASQVSSAISTGISGKEDTSNKVTSISSSSTDTQYPTAKCVYSLLGNVESLINAL